MLGEVSKLVLADAFSGRLAGNLNSIVSWLHKMKVVLRLSSHFRFCFLRCTVLSKNAEVNIADPSIPEV